MYKNEQLTELRQIEDLVDLDEINAKEFSILKENFYFSKNVFSLENNRDSLLGVVDKNEFKQIYLSYQTLNNSFDEIPDTSLLDLKKFSKYKFDIETISSVDLEIIPYIIHYRNSQKDKLTKLTHRNQVIDFTDDEKCRLTFKVIGNGKFEISRIRITPKGWHDNE